MPQGENQGETRGEKRKGDVFEITADRLGLEGDGLARDARGAVVILPGALPGERVRATVQSFTKEGVVGRVTDLLQASPARVSPPCPHFGMCGGCRVQHLSTPARLEWKRDVLLGALAQHGLHDIPVRDTVSVPPATRRRLTLVARAPTRSQGVPIMGFNARASRDIVEVTHCPVARPELVRLFPLLRQALTPWVRAARELDITLTWTDSGADILITGPAPPRTAPLSLADLLQGPHGDGIARLSHRLRERSPAEPLLTARTPFVSLGGVQVALPPGAFLQPSREGEALLLQAIQEGGEGVKKGPIADLFAGCGTFSLPLALQTAVEAVEGDAEAVSALGAAARQNQLTRLHAQQRDLFRDPLSARELNRFSAVVFDPPRAGASAQSAELARSTVARLIAVSCNPGTFARDLATLIRGGYRVDWVQPVDQFVWSTHMEVVACLSRK